MEQLIQAMVQQLGEPDPGAVAQIRAVVTTLGPERAAVLVRTVVRLEQLGGCLVVNGARRRTPGGIFLVLARACMSKAQQRVVWPETTNPPCGKQEGPVQSLGGEQALGKAQDARASVAQFPLSVNTERRYTDASVPVT